jgi:predicted Zn-dependent protease
MIHPGKPMAVFPRWTSAVAAGVIAAACVISTSLFAADPSAETTTPPITTRDLDLTVKETEAPETIALPDMGAAANNLMSAADERRLGQAFMRSVRRSVKVVDDPLLAEYIQDLGNRLVSHSNSSGKQFTFFLVEDPQVNAFAGPGGYIGVHTGLVTATETESELASVIAHEIAHVTQNHLFRAFDEYSRLSGPAALLMVGAVLLGATVSSEAGLAALAGVQAGMAQAQLNFTRANEEEADREGIKILAGGNYDPRAMPVFFGRMAQATRLYESNTPEFLRTHPVTSNRIADAMGRAEQYPYRHPAPDNRYFQLRATLRLESFKNPGDAVTFFRKSLKDGRYRNEDAQRYGYALALIEARDYQEARAEIERLLKQQPSDPAYLIASARLDYASGHRDKAKQTLEAALELFPSSYPLAMHYAEILLETGEAHQARRILGEQLRRRPGDVEVLKLAARAAGASGNLGEAYQFQAEYYYLTGQVESAVRQLEIALKEKDLDYYQSARLAARLNEYKAELAAIKAASR